MDDKDLYFILGGSQSHSHSHNHTVTEKRAPTDESVKLLREMEVSAKDNVHRSVRLSENGFECMIQIYVEPHLARTMLVARFQLNGKAMEAEVEIADIWNKKPNPQEVAQKVIDAIAKKIASECLYPLHKAAIEAHLI